MKLTVSLESLVIAAICTADMIATVIFVMLGRACESNPLMATCIRHSIYTFITVKVASFIPLIVVCEHYRRSNPAFVRLALRTAIVLYLIAYVALVAHQNI